MDLTPENAPCWQDQYRPREIWPYGIPSLGGQRSSFVYGFTFSL